MDQKRTEHSKYIELLTAIIENAKNFKFAGARLLEHKKSRPFAQFMFYNCIEECGKFLLVRDQYPKSLSKRMLKSVGFEDHNKKIERVIRNISYVTHKLYPHKDVSKIRKIIRQFLREQSLYVNYSNDRPILPAFTGSKKVLNSLVSAVINTIKFCDLGLEKFKKSPFG